MTSPPRLLLTGHPGVGKTTALQRVAVRLREVQPDLRIGGFYTEEVRDDSGSRVGFRGETFGRAEEEVFVVIARAGASGPRVGKYGVDVAAVDRLAQSLDPEEVDLVLLDEIGKMECHSEAFCEAVVRLLTAPVPVLATVARRGGRLIAAVKARPDTTVLEVTRENRDRLPGELVELLVPSRT